MPIFTHILLPNDKSLGIFSLSRPFILTEFDEDILCLVKSHIFEVASNEDFYRLRIPIIRQSFRFQERLSILTQQSIYRSQLCVTRMTVKQTKINHLKVRKFQLLIA